MTAAYLDFSEQLAGTHIELCPNNCLLLTEPFGGGGHESCNCPSILVLVSFLSILNLKFHQLSEFPEFLRFPPP